MFIVRLHRLYTALQVLIEKFGSNLSADFDSLWSDIETLIATKSWTDIKQVITDAESLYTDFLTTYSGSESEVRAFLNSLHDLFAR